MTSAEQKKAIKAFIERWKNAEGDEQRESQKFWIELCQDVLGMKNPTHVLDFERRVRGRRIDVFCEDMGILIEQKSRVVPLDDVRHTAKYGDETAYDQALWYYDKLIRSQKPRWIITCNFDEFRIYDMDEEYPEKTYVTVLLDNLDKDRHLFSFFTNESTSRITVEKELSVKAGYLVGKLYDELAKQYLNLETDEREQRSLNIVITRLVFLLYAEDAGLLQEHLAFLKYMKLFDASASRQALIQLFKVLDTPEDQRDPYMRPELLAFPYVNGGLFADEDIIVPQISEQLRVDLLAEASAGFDWSGISPTIFGAVFESTLNPETRRAGGMHYTSIENIHKVIDPLFLDDLKAELADIEGEKVLKNKQMKLKLFQRKLASINVLDPACGSGNFLTETYLSLRKLENRVLESLNADSEGAPRMGFDIDESDTIMVSIGQLYGIEINDFAVSVAKTALWIAEAQAMEETSEIVYQPFEFFPLKAIANIHEGNALRMDWNDVLPASRCSFIVGNPPFVGASFCSTAQKQEIVDLFGKIKLSNSLDYVTGWYYKSCEMMAQNNMVKAALVSTNSISQGEQVAPLWGTLYDRFGVHIDFAWRTFVWNNEAINQAHVHCVIIGFDANPHSSGGMIISPDGTKHASANVNPYLVDAPFAVIASRSKPLCDVPELTKGNQPTDDGNFILSEDERATLLNEYPEVEPFIHRYIGARDYLNNNEVRYCIWLKDVPAESYSYCTPIMERLDAIRVFRAASTAAPTRKFSEKPWQFFSTPQTDEDFIIVPRVSSQRRAYIPMGFMDSSSIGADSLSIVCGARLYHLGVMMSQFHNAWMRVVAGRLKSDYRYSGGVVYNNFIWPDPTLEQREAIEACAQAILDTRDNYPDKSLADLYDPDKMPEDLLAAHKALDRVVEAAYGVDFDGDEEKIVAHLFKLYAEKTQGK